MIPEGSIIDLPLPAPFESRLKFLAFKRESDGEIYIELLAPLMVWTRCGFIEVSEKFISDGASIPKLAQAIVGDPFEFDFLAAAIIHDALYRKGFLDYITRAKADLIFRDLLWDTEVPFWKIPPFFAAVRSFGWRSYKKIESIKS
jgi:hypothetical protein